MNWPVAPSLNCTAGSIAWAHGSDTLTHHATGEGRSFQRDVLQFLVGKWVVLIGDSTARIMYHQLAALLSGKWTVWSGDGDTYNHFEAGSCFDLVCPWTTVVCPCLEEAFVGGARLTMVFSKFGVQDDLQLLTQLANRTVGVPNAVLVCIGTWWAMKDTWKAVGWSGSHTAQYQQALRGVAAATEAAFGYRRVQRVNGTVVAAPNYLREAWAVPPRYVLMGLPTCGSFNVPHNTAQRTNTLIQAAYRLGSTELLEQV